MRVRNKVLQIIVLIGKFFRSDFITVGVSLSLPRHSSVVRGRAANNKRSRELWCSLDHASHLINKIH